ncbi:uncharacterized protein Dwil_GK27688 [Drosophila willistoni]|uniref:L-aminoadipate-semialdehyde dehydrogenase-phosphopantetheinyl transferase n=1 Tax=Drosophila willistoni TaxID=7260 RepID=A0A0Q9WS34_DROWI|nr:uncharacterized protein Dwil_GK27688 [Drosophila willistoni]
MNKHICTRWAFDLGKWTPTLAQLSKAVAVIQIEERQRLMKFHFIDDFLSSLIGRLLMRKYVSGCSHEDYQQVQFKRDARGKPYWLPKCNKGDGDDEGEGEGGSMLSFNVSHQGKLVVLAGIARSDPTCLGEEGGDEFGIGVDVMKISYDGGRPLKDFFRLMKSKFSTQEWSFIGAQSSDRGQLKAFMRHWCLKEAYVKELGVGITIDLEKISFNVDASHTLEESSSPLQGTILHCDDTLMTNWRFEEHLLDEDYCAAIAFRNCLPVDQEKFTWLHFNDLIPPDGRGDAIGSVNGDILEYCKQALLKPYKKS